jgi:hypothetical protein
VVASATPVPSTLGGVTYVSINLTADGLSNNTGFLKLRIYRDADAAGDTALGDAELVGVKITWRRGN